LGTPPSASKNRLKTAAKRGINGMVGNWRRNFYLCFIIPALYSPMGNYLKVISEMVLESYPV
jgi:hypothetical protein